MLFSRGVLSGLDSLWHGFHQSFPRNEPGQRDMLYAREGIRVRREISPSLWWLTTPWNMRFQCSPIHPIVVLDDRAITRSRPSLLNLGLGYNAAPAQPVQIMPI
jgi:hypothetical protein